MIIHPPIHCLWVDSSGSPQSEALAAYLDAIAHVQLRRSRLLPEELTAYEVLVTVQGEEDFKIPEHIAAFVRAGNGWLHLIREPLRILPDIFGAQVQSLGAPTELRLLFAHPDAPMARRLPEAMYASDEYLCLIPADGHTRVILHADWRYSRKPVLILRPAGSGHVAATTLQSLSHPGVQQVIYRMIRQLAGQSLPQRPVGVAILGYPPWLGRLHGTGIETTPGLQLKAVCDMAASQRAQAQSDFPEITTYGDAGRLAAEPTIDLVIVATPPDTHADLSLQMMRVGKHVVCEKPLALKSTQTAAMVDLSRQAGVLLCCHQNRRFDADFLAIRQALDEGWLGELFYMETFVGGYNHPCGYWHSHAPVCGGAAFDWGGHYLDWIVGLMPGPVAAVQGSRHKRVWHDTTNADQERIQMRFGGGQEAEFLHSDIAAARKPKWYLLGTQGAVVGDWQDVSVHLPDPVLFFETYVIPPTEMPPRLTLYHRNGKGGQTARPLATPRREPFAFHRNLADHLEIGEPLVAPLEDSVTVVAILEAAGRSMARGSTWELLHE